MNALDDAHADAEGFNALDALDAFDAFERRAWEGRAEAYRGSFAALCAYPVGMLLDAAGVGGGGGSRRVLDAGTGPGTVAGAAVGRGAEVVAVDAEPSMVALAAEAVPEAEVRHAVLPELPFPDGHFDAVVSNFVLNHVGRPRAVLAALRRVTRPGGRIAVTIWTSPHAPGQALLGRAVAEAGVERPADAPALTAAEDFPRTEEGLAGILADAGLPGAVTRTVGWDHLVDPEVWWSGPAAGIATVGQLLVAQPPEVIAEIRAAYDRLSEEFLRPDGRLALPHTALLASSVVPERR
ncbi:Ubiquinone/menaquinone biosynthesis C-methylase UbiE [Actinacidiphila alni]|uniref:Ubiquinone/menaquinone biosynthesis C-methylase UbiE n=1 Tax=Actinacidiphila alni TaxID=380248 RepID=A0A1I2D8L8_9ACTN|nr:Ubiquinone/menaquinone biosynthesis C-methylase UbiE [Actinacidiphila alni]